MYKPANIREFVTLAAHKKASMVEINGRFTKEYVEVANLRGKFKLKGTSETNANGLTLVNNKTTFITWFKPNIEASDILNINGIDFEIVGEPENVEMRGRYMIINLERIGGGA